MNLGCRGFPWVAWAEALVAAAAAAQRSSATARKRMQEGKRAVVVVMAGKSGGGCCEMGVVASLFVGEGGNRLRRATASTTAVALLDDGCRDLCVHG